MRTTAKLLLMIGPALALVLPAVPAARAAGTAHATIANFSFSPDPVKVPVGTTLEWTNTDGTAHTVTADDGSFGSTSLAKDAKFSHTFNQPGPVTYHCAIHPSMKGTVQVEASPTTAEPTTTTTAAPTTTTTATAPTTTTTTTAASPPTTAGLASPKPTSPKPAVSSTTRATAATTTSTTAPAPTSTTLPAQAAVPTPTAPPTQAALDTPSGESGNGGAIGLGVGIAAVLLAGGGGWWAWRRRVSAG